MLIMARTQIHLFSKSLVLAVVLLGFWQPSWAVTPEQVAKLTAEADSANGAFFGWSVDIENDTVVVGADDESVQGYWRAGAAYVFTRSDQGVWSRQQKLVAVNAEGAFDGGSGDQFGYRVAISGDTIIVGAYRDDDASGDEGSAYVFTRADGVWSLQQKLLTSDRAGGDRFPSSIALSGDTAFFGVHRDGYDINGDSVDERFVGSVYVFTRSGTTWSQQEKLLPGDAAAFQSFGGDVALSGDTLLVSASGDDSNKGAGYIFTRSGPSWIFQAKLVGSDSIVGDRVGSSAALSGDTAILGAPNGNLTATGNKAYVFVRNGDTWSQQAKLTGSDPNPGHFFGTVDLFGDTAVIGADNDDANGVSSGAAYIFTRSDGIWTERAKFYASDASALEWFGAKVALSGDTAVVTAPSAIFTYPGCEPRPNCFNPDLGPGSVYIFDLQSGETPVGTDVVVDPVPVDENGDPVEDAPDISLEFGEVLVGGDTTVTSTESAPPGQELPDGFKLTGLTSGATYFDISTDADFIGVVEICIDYSGLAIAGNPSKLKFLHYNEILGAWEDITSSNDTTNSILCGVTDSFSLFAIAEASDPVEVLSDLMTVVSEINANRGIINSLDAKLQAAEQALEDASVNNDFAALHVMMDAFVNSVEAQRGNKISDSEADALIKKAQEIALTLLL